MLNRRINLIGACIFKFLVISGSLSISQEIDVSPSGTLSSQKLLSPKEDTKNAPTADFKDYDTRTNEINFKKCSFGPRLKKGWPIKLKVKVKDLLFRLTSQDPQPDPYNSSSIVLVSELVEICDTPHYKFANSYLHNNSLESSADDYAWYAEMEHKTHGRYFPSMVTHSLKSFQKSICLFEKNPNSDSTDSEGKYAIQTVLHSHFVEPRYEITDGVHRASYALAKHGPYSYVYIQYSTEVKDPGKLDEIIPYPYGTQNLSK